jgi:hypothetical protein
MLTHFIYYLFGNADGGIDKTALWTAALVIVTFILLLVAYFQLSNIKKTARAEYIKRLNDSFFTEETRNLIVLLFNSAIELSILPIMDKEGKDQIDELPYFKIKEFVLEQLKNSGLISLAEWRKGYNAFEIDDLLIGHFDDVGRFEKNGLLDIHTAYSTFGYYVLELVGNSEDEETEVRKYLNDPKCGCQGNYNDLEYIHKEFISYKNMKNKCWCARKLWSIWHSLTKYLA